MAFTAFHLTEGADEPEFMAVDLPEIGANDVLMDVAACGINFADTLMIQGRYQDTPARPFTIGMEASGIVRAVGSNVSDLTPGDRVAAFPGHGGLAPKVVVSRDRVVVLPKEINLTTAAGFMVAYGTSELAYDQAQLTKADRVLVLGASSGVGLTAIEVAKAIGASVTAVARSPEKCAAAKAAGADLVIDAAQGNLDTTLRALPRFDVVYDPVGGDQYTAAIRACAPLARYILIGFASGTLPELPANILLVKNITVIGFNWGGYLKFAPDRFTASLDRLVSLIQNGKLQPAPAHVLPFQKAARALEMLRSREVRGKVVVEVQTLE